MTDEEKTYSLDVAGRICYSETHNWHSLQMVLPVRYGDTVVLSTVTASKQPREGIDFFP